MKKNKKKKGFTLVELLAVIVILAIILVIAIPQIVNTIKASRLGAIESSAKLIASNADEYYLAQQTLDPNYTGSGVECSDVSKLSNDYESCSITYNNGKATVKLKGAAGSKFNNIKCSGTKDNMSCQEKGALPGYSDPVEYITNLCNNTSGCNEGTNTSGLVKITHNDGAIVEYRYRGGTSINNIATFNGEDKGWRVVGLFEVDDGEGNVEQRIKLVRANALGNYSWDSSASGVNSGYGINEWNQADLMNELNGDYLNATEDKSWYNGTNNTQTATFTYTTKLTADAQELIGPAKWYLGGFSSNGITRDAAWEAERSGVTCQYLKSNPSEAGCLMNGTNDGVEREEYWIGKVGLIYPSDFGYASNSCSAMNRCGSNTNNWMYNYGWTISPYSSNAVRAWYVSSRSVYYNTACNNSGVRPSVYLVSDVQIKGSGTTSDPFEFAI